MKKDLKDILSNLSAETDQETLLKYLQGHLDEQQKHEVEKNMMQDEFDDAALEGLQEIRDKARIQYTVEMLNRDLRKKTEKVKLRRQKMRLKYQPWIYASILILILLMVIAYIAITRMMRH